MTDRTPLITLGSTITSDSSELSVDPDGKAIWTNGSGYYFYSSRGVGKETLPTGHYRWPIYSIIEADKQLLLTHENSFTFGEKTVALETDNNGKYLKINKSLIPIGHKDDFGIQKREMIKMLPTDEKWLSYVSSEFKWQSTTDKHFGKLLTTRMIIRYYLMILKDCLNQMASYV